MPLRRRYRDGRVVSTTKDLYLDRLSRWSDIQEYLPFLHEMAKAHPHVLELGTRQGNSTAAFLAGVEKARGHVTSVDINPCPRIAAHPLWTFIQADDMTLQIDGPFELLFIDTSHYYQHTLDECRKFMPLLKPGGVALFHDTKVIPHPHEYEWHEDYPPVRKALDDYCAEEGLSWEEIPGEYGMGLIRV